MYYRRLLCLAVVALSIAPAAAQWAAGYQQRRTFLSSHSEALFLETLPFFFASPDRSSVNLSSGEASNMAPATFISGGASPRRLSIDTFFSPERRQQLLGDVGERERAEQEEENRQQSQPFTPSEAVVTPGKQLQTYLTENQRPLSGLTYESIESQLSSSAERSSDGIPGRSSPGAPRRRVANEKAAGLNGRTALMNGKEVAQSAAAQRASPHKSYSGLPKTLSVGGVAQADAADVTRSIVFVANDADADTILYPAEGRLLAQNQSALLTSAREKEKQYGNASAASRSGAASTASSPAAWILHTQNRNANHQEGAASHSRTSLLNTSDASIKGDRDSLLQAAVEHARVTPDNLQSRNKTLAEDIAAPPSITKFLTLSQEKEHETAGERAATAALEKLYSGRNGQNQQLVAGIHDASATALGSLDTRGIATSRRMEAADLLPTASVGLPASSTPAPPSEAAGAHRGWWPFGGSSISTSKQEEERASAAGTRVASRTLSTGLKEAVGTVKNTAVEEAKKAANATRETAQEEMAKRSGPFSNVIWYFTASKEEKEKAAAKAAVDAAVPSLTTNQSAAAAALPAAFVTERVSSETVADAQRGQVAGMKLSPSSLTSRLLPQWHVPDSSAQQETKTALSQAFTTVDASPEPRNRWVFGDKADETTKHQQRQRNSNSSSSVWWGNAGASATDLKDVADTVQNVTADKAKGVFETTRESTEKKAKEDSGPLSSLLWFFTSSKQGKKEAAAKAAVNAALSWIADSQQQMQAALKTLLPTSASQSRAQAATPSALDSDATSSASSEKPSDGLPANVPGFFQLEDVLQRLITRQQQLRKFTDAQATDWYSSMQQQVKKQGLSAALAAWLYAGSSDSSTQTNSPSSYYVQKAQHIGAPPVSSPFFPAGLWSNTAGGNARQQQHQQAQPLQAGSASSPPLQWLKDLFTRKGKAYGKPQTVVAANQHEHLGDSSSWASWIGGGHQKAPETQASNLIRKAATSALIDSQGEILSERSSTLLPLANTVNWMLPTGNTSNDSEGSSTGSPRSSEGPATRAALSNPKNWAVDAGAVAPLASKVALSLQSALVGGSKNEEAAHASNEPIRAPGLKPGVYWWEWQAYPSDETSAKANQPTYLRHIHLDCDPVLPFQACTRECQKESARSLLRSSSNKKAEETEGTENGTASTDLQRQEPLALGSYEFSTLRSCYLNCKQKWLDRDLPGCLRADGVKVEGTPPAAAYRSTTTSTTTTTTTTTPQSSAAAAETVDSSPHQSQGFWSRMRNSKPEDDSDTNNSAEKEREASAFSFFRGRMPAEKSSSPAAETEHSRSIKNLFGLLMKRKPVPPPTPKLTVRESLVNFTQNFWHQLKNGEANVADALGAAVTPITKASSSWGADSLQLPTEKETRPAEEIVGADERSAQNAAVENNRRGWKLPWTVGVTVDRQSSQPVSVAAENITQAQDTDEPKIAGDIVEPKLSFKTWCILLVLCIGGALVSICLVALRSGEMLSRLWMRVQSDGSPQAAASWLRRHLYEQINPLNDGCMQKCMQQLNVRSSEEGMDDFERSKSTTQPLIRDSRLYL